MDHNKIQGDAYLARHAARDAANEGKLVWMLSWGGLTVASFPMRWWLGYSSVALPIAVGICFVLASILGVSWYFKAKSEIARLRLLQSEKRQEIQAKMRELHLEKLRKSSRQGEND